MNKKFNLVMNVFCLFVWLFSFLSSIAYMIMDKPVQPLSYMCATLVCVLYYTSEIIRR